MHWKWPELGDAKEAKQREKILANMDAFWSAFQDKLEDLDALFSREKEWDLPAWMDNHLAPIAKGIMWEFGPAVELDGHRLILTGEGNYALQPLIDAMIARAPKIEGWELYRGRLPEEGEMLQATLEGRSGEKMPSVRASVARGEHHCIDLAFEIAGMPKKKAEDLIELLAETVVGEHRLIRWIGDLSLAKKGAKDLLPLGQVRAAVEKEIAAIESELPDTPCIDRVDTAEWSLYQSEPDEQDDYEDQDDIMVAPTMDPELWVAARSSYFADERFSRHGEIFAYVKMDGRDGLKGTKFEDREDIENAITEAIGKDRLGAVVGGGTGRFYSYIELALLEVPRAVAAIRKVLVDGGITKRSWVLFHDPALAGERVGIHGDAPPPP
jgi:hypothetical protein